jgi:hypothetical protein
MHLRQAAFYDKLTWSLQRTRLVLLVIPLTLRSELGQTRSFGDVGSMSGLPESGYMAGWSRFFTFFDRPARYGRSARFETIPVRAPREG